MSHSRTFIFLLELVILFVIPSLYAINSLSIEFFVYLFKYSSQSQTYTLEIHAKFSLHTCCFNVSLYRLLLLSSNIHSQSYGLSLLMILTRLFLSSY